MLIWLLESSLIATLLALIAVAASRWRRTGPAVLHALWLVVIVRLVIPPLVEWPWELRVLSRASDVPTEERASAPNDEARERGLRSPDGFTEHTATTPTIEYEHVDLHAVDATVDVGARHHTSDARVTAAEPVYEHEMSGVWESRRRPGPAGSNSVGHIPNASSGADRGLDVDDSFAKGAIEAAIERRPVDEESIEEERSLERRPGVPRPVLEQERIEALVAELRQTPAVSLPRAETEPGPAEKRPAPAAGLATKSAVAKTAADAPSTEEASGAETLGAAPPPLRKTAADAPSTEEASGAETLGAAPPPLRWTAARWSAAASIVWALGAMVVAWLHLRRCWSLRRLLATGRPAGRRIEAVAAEAADRLGVSVPRVTVCDGTRSPMVWGFLRPVLALPTALVERLTDDEWRAVCLHEIAHLRRRDQWVGLLILLAHCISWWNPLFWYARRQLNQNAELCCDAWVVWALPSRRRDYASTLIEVVRFVSTLGTPSRSPALGMADGTRKAFERRLVMILQETVSPRARLSRLVAIALLCTLALPGWTLAERSSSDTPPAARVSGDVGGTDTGTAIIDTGDTASPPRPNRDRGSNAPAGIDGAVQADAVDLNAPTGVESGTKDAPAIVGGDVATTRSGGNGNAGATDASDAPAGIFGELVGEPRTSSTDAPGGIFGELVGEPRTSSTDPATDAPSGVFGELVGQPRTSSTDAATDAPGGIFGELVGEPRTSSTDAGGNFGGLPGQPRPSSTATDPDAPSDANASRPIAPGESVRRASGSRPRVAAPATDPVGGLDALQPGAPSDTPIPRPRRRGATVRNPSNSAYPPRRTGTRDNTPRTSAKSGRDRTEKRLQSLEKQLTDVQASLRAILEALGRDQVKAPRPTPAADDLFDAANPLLSEPVAPQPAPAPPQPAPAPRRGRRVTNPAGSFPPAANPFRPTVRQPALPNAPKPTRRSRSSGTSAEISFKLPADAAADLVRVLERRRNQIESYTLKKDRITVRLKASPNSDRHLDTIQRFVVEVLGGKLLEISRYRAPSTSTQRRTTTPNAELRVVAVDSPNNLVVLSAGQDKQVQVGDRYRVLKGSKKAGEVEVFKVYDDLSGARIVEIQDEVVLEANDRVQPADVERVPLNDPETELERLDLDDALEPLEPVDGPDDVPNSDFDF